MSTPTPCVCVCVCGHAVVYVDLPGSATRRDEPSISNPDALIEKLYSEVVPRLSDGLPFAFVGYSFGCITSYHIALLLKERANLSPVGVSFIDLPAHMTPHELQVFVTAAAAVPGLKYVPHVSDMLSTWYARGLTQPLPCGATCFNGETSQISREMLQRWAPFHNPGFGQSRELSIRSYPGDHWSISEQFNEVVRDICLLLDVGYTYRPSRASVIGAAGAVATAPGPVQSDRKKNVVYVYKVI